MSKLEQSDSPPDVAHASIGACDAGIRRAFDFLGKRWNGVILGTLSGEALGFAELRRGVGSITDSVLSDRLSELVHVGWWNAQSRRDGHRAVVSTDTGGRDLLPVLDQLGQWAHVNLPESDCASAR